MYDRVLFPTDGSDGARQATEHALAIASGVDAPVHAVNVVERSPTRATDAYSDVALEQLEREGEQHLAEVEERGATAGVEVTREVREGTPEEEIVDAAEPGDLLVIGTHGRTGIERFVLGSTAERVVRAADVPVVTVPVADGPAADE